MPLFGKDATTWYSSVLFTGSNVADDLTWVGLTSVVDESDSFGAVRVDATTRLAAASGFGTEATVLNALTVTFSYIKELADTTWDAIWTAMQTPGTPIALMFLSGLKTATTSKGFAGNWTFDLNWEKEVKGLQIQNVTAVPLQYVAWVTGAASL